MSIETLGWLAGVMLAFCGAPQALQSVRQGHSEGLSPAFLGLWTVGEVFALFYVIGKHGLDGPLLFNYTVNLVFVVVLWRYWLFPCNGLGEKKADARPES